jgi:hypothetical protein
MTGVIEIVVVETKKKSQSKLGRVGWILYIFPSYPG